MAAVAVAACATPNEGPRVIWDRSEATPAVYERERAECELTMEALGQGAPAAAAPVCTQLNLACAAVEARRRRDTTARRFRIFDACMRAKGWQGEETGGEGPSVLHPDRFE